MSESTETPSGQDRAAMQQIAPSSFEHRLEGELAAGYSALDEVFYLTAYK